MTPAESRLVPSGWAPARRGRPRSAVRLLGPIRRLCAALVIAAFALVEPRITSAAPSASAPPEHQVKAEFIERFTRFVDWPDSAFASSSSAFVVCVWGRGPLASQLERVVTRAPIKGRAVRVLHVESRERIQPCHILYVATHEPAVVRDIVASTRGKPILSIGDQPGLAEEGLLINLVLDREGFVRFELNLDVARISGLKISAKLIRLARRVGTRR
jgi:hypothetical protein